ncbi:MAG: hypothetical protein HY231_14250 [Acidobacteria bacterium]|nr:hypothetical protein [Acidobacteriota bacterium]
MKPKVSPIRQMSRNPSWPVKIRTAADETKKSGYWRDLTQGLRDWLQRFRHRHRRTTEPMDIKSIEERVRKALYP